MAENIEAKTLVITIVVFANADGGDITIGIFDKTQRFVGIDYNVKNINELLKTQYDCTW